MDPAESLRCPFCHDVLEAEVSGLLECSACMAPHHAECFVEGRGCAATGCEVTVARVGHVEVPLDILESIASNRDALTRLALPRREGVGGREVAVVLEAQRLAADPIEQSIACLPQLPVGIRRAAGVGVALGEQHRAVEESRGVGAADPGVADGSLRGVGPQPQPAGAAVRRALLLVTAFLLTRSTPLVSLRTSPHR